MIIREKVRVGDQLVTLETGRIAKQADGSCLVRAGDTIVLVTACGSREARPGQSFFPLSVDYIEKTYAAGKIPGGFFKREGKLRDYEVLTSRLIDRPCRPLFPEGYLCDVQIVATVMSFDQENPPDTLAMIGASAALHMSPVPWNGPIAGVRVGRVNGEFIANPTYAQIAQSDCDLIVAASRDAIVMVEGEAEEISEEDMIEALLFAHQSVQDVLDLMERVREAVGKPKWAFEEAKPPAILRERLEQVAGARMAEACNIADKHARAAFFKQLRKEAMELLLPEFPDQPDAIKAAYEELRYDTTRAQVLDEGRRLDGRDTQTVRPISIELSVLPRAHGSSLFTRGETQAIVTTTLGTSREAQRLDTLLGDEHKRFMLHYNFPPYSVGETKPMRGPGRREVGHGNLAERALVKMLPSPEQFPYTIRIVSEITESNGSSSMASVCGGALALMDAGVPIKAPVAGVAMGLIKEGDDFAILTDILGEEDALGDMDFKVCGTDRGVTAIQMDIKIEGLSREILEAALAQAREARLHILKKMQRAIAAPREALSPYAPRITQIRVKPDQVRTIIGPGGKMIRAIVDQTGASIDVEDDGTVSVASADSAAVEKALEIIKSLTTEPEIGEVYEGTVRRVEPYGAFLEILPGKDGLCHISDIDWTHVTSVEDYMNLGDKVSVKVTNIDRDGRIRLSRKDAMPEPVGAAKLNGRTQARAGEEPEARPERRGAREERKREERLSARRGRDTELEETALLESDEIDLDERLGARPALTEERPKRRRDLGEEVRPRGRRLDERPSRPLARTSELDEAAPVEELDERPRQRTRPALDVDETPRLRTREAERERPAPRPRTARPLEPEEAPRPRAARALEPEDAPRPRTARPLEPEEAPRPRAGRALEPEEAPRPRAGRALEPEEAPRPRAGRALEPEEAPRPRLRGRPIEEREGAERPRRTRPLEADEAPRRPRARPADEAPARRGRPELEAAPRGRTRRPLDLEERPARTRDLDLEGAPRPRSRRPLDLEERPVRARGLDLEEAPRPRSRRPLDLEERPQRGRDLEEAPRPRARRTPDPEEALPRRRSRPLAEPEEAPRPLRGRGRGPDPADDLAGDFDGGRARRGLRSQEAGEPSGREPARAGRDLTRAERPPRARGEPRLEGPRGRAEDDAPARPRDAELRPRRRARFEEDADLEAGRPALREPRFDQPVEASSLRERTERTERDRPSRTRARARNRERVRELERERERR